MLLYLNFTIFEYNNYSRESYRADHSLMQFCSSTFLFLIIRSPAILAIVAPSDSESRRRLRAQTGKRRQFPRAENK